LPIRHYFVNMTVILMFGVTIKDRMVLEKSRGSLHDVIGAVPNIVDHFRNDVKAPHARVSPDRTPVPMEFSNWREEQRAWRETAVLFDQSHHMPELFLKGPDAFRLLQELGVNSLSNLTTSRAKQYVGCNARGQIIGDCVLHMLNDQSYELISGMTLLNWVEFQAGQRNYDVEIVRDHNTADNPSGTRTNFRYGMDGPNAGAIFSEVIEGDLPKIPFFCTARVRIAGHQILALRHGMAGHHGVELSGPYEAGQEVLDAILAVGSKLGLCRGGTRSYFSSNLESGWIGYPLPAIYTGDDMSAFREWLPADGWEANFQMGGSYYSPNIEDYYTTPYDHGYDNIVKFDHDFMGREALEQLSISHPRTKVTLAWNAEDVEKVFGSYMEDGTPCKFIERPVADYALAHTDELRTPDGRLVGISTHCGYSINEREQLSLALVDRTVAEPGTELLLIWGEPSGGTRKPRVERHRQTPIRVTVSPVPYAKTATRMKKASIEARA
jgi:vanillate/3-O-methylgallate O-demethylase